MKILALYTAGEPASVALRTESAESAVELERGRQFERLAATARVLLAEAAVEAGLLDGVAVARGPGSFTGLRSGAGVALGLARATGVELYAVGTLEIWAAQALAEVMEEGVCHVVLDAGRGRLYHATFRAGQAERASRASRGGEAGGGARVEAPPVLLDGPNVLGAEEALSRLGGVGPVVGDVGERLIRVGLDPRRVGVTWAHRPLALALARLVAANSEHYACEARDFTLDYLHEPQAVKATAAGKE